MSLPSQRLATAVACDASITSLQTVLLSASNYPAIARGDVAAAIAQLTRTAAESLNVERAGVWLYQDRKAQLVEANTYVLSQRCHTAGRQLQTADYPDYFLQQATNQRHYVLDSTLDGGDSFTQRWLLPRQVGALIAVPVYQQGQITGWIWYENIEQPRQWQDSEQVFAISIANLVTATLSNQLHQQRQATAQQQQQRAVILSDTLRTIGTSPSDRTLLQQMAQELSSLYQALGCEIWRYSSEDTAPLKPTAAYPQALQATAETAASTALSLTPQLDPFLQQVIATPQGLASNALTTSPLTSSPRTAKTVKPNALASEPLAASSGPSSPSVPHWGTSPDCLGQHWMILPTLYGGHVNGFVSFRFPQAEFIPTDKAQAQLQDFALYIGIVLAHDQLVEQEKTQKGTLDRQHQQLRREIIERQQAEQAWQESQRFIQSILDASTNILYVNNFDTGENFYINRCLTAVLGYAPEELKRLGANYLEQLSHPDDIVQMRSQRVKLAHLNDGEIVESEYRFRHQHGGWRWLLCRETVFHRDPEGRPTQIFGTATDITQRKQAEVALHEVNRELQRLASIDGLTEVANRRCFDKQLNQEWESLRYNKAPLTLILCDIDYFKRYNDEYGHQSGDMCLKQVAQAIRRAVKRASDLVARYGGEEFAVVLPNTDLEGAHRVATNIQQEILTLNIPHCRSLIDSCITVSMGVASVTEVTDSSPDALVAAADRGLYRAKYEGRNRTCTETF